MSNKNTKITCYSSKWLSRRLDDVIDSTVESIGCFCVDPVSNFTRSRILTPKTLIKFIIGLQAHSLPSEVSDYFTSSETVIPSVSAVSQRRDLLYPEIFKSINRRFLSSIDNLSTMNGYYILAQDGSDINLPFLQDDTQITYSQDAVVCQYHLNALYDCINHVFWESRIDLPTKKSEIGARIDFINQRNYPENSIITADRGYESYNLIAHCIENNQKFVFRVKDISTRNGIMTSLSLPDETFDITVTRTLTNLQTKEVKKNESNQFVFVPSTSVFDYLDACNHFYDLRFRIVRFKIADDKYETLVTNLDENKFKLDDFKDLYRLRWNEEIAFYYLKHAVGMLYFHCKKRQHIQQEIYASILFYNYANLIIQNIKKNINLKKTKYIYNINVRSALTNIRNYFRNQIKESILIRNIKKYLTPSRPDRKVQRSIKRQSPKALNNRTS
ncbi:IS4 family transposase [Faecalibacillus faecis]|uniref:IS4 family transposase n=1 Tax=Faecalibacillus faecis TaxID=1982628 RepID=UPI0022E8596A|nr:IS4 family transposase [Faecalibacillus faecis]